MPVMRIGLIGPLPPPPGGMANQTRQLSRLLVKEGLHVELVQTNTPYKPSWVEQVRGIRALFRLVPYLRALWIAAGRVDLFHVMANSGWSWHLFAAPAIWIGWLRGIPVVLNYRGGEIEEFFERSFHWVRPSLNRVAVVIVPSGYTAEVFRRRGFDVRIVKNIIDTERFMPTDRRSRLRTTNGPHLLVTRNLEPIYDIHTALHVLQRVSRVYPEARLTVCGSGPDKAALLRLASELGVSNAVTFAGNTDNDSIAELYRSADVLLNTSLADNMPVSVLEALACGVPIVSTNVGGVPYLVTHEKTALLTAPRDDKAMAEAILSLVRNPELSRSLVTAGLNQIQDYTWSKVKQNLLPVYDSVVGTMSEPQPGLLVFSTLFPSTATPNAGLFIRERMFRVAKHVAGHRGFSATLVSGAGIDSTFSATRSAANFKTGTSGRSDRLLPALLLGSVDFEAAGRRVHGSRELSFIDPAQKTKKIHASGCPFRLSGRLCRNLAGQMVEAASNYYAARYRAAPQQKPLVASVSGLRIAQSLPNIHRVGVTATACDCTRC